MEISDDQRMTAEEIDEATAGVKGRERWQLAARVAEDRAFGLGWEAREAKLKTDWELAGADGADQDDGEERQTDTESPDYLAGFEAGVASQDEEEEMVKCPKCNETGKIIGWGGQCKRCFGSTKVKASSLEPEEVPDEETAEEQPA